MTPEEFYAMPVALQVRRLIEAFPQVASKIMSGEAPKKPSSPKFDTRIRRKDGFIWASECSLDALQFWYGRAKQGGNEKYREKNEKDAKALSFFIAWREWFPSERWSGERNRQQVTADAPSSKPTVRQWEPRGGEAPRSKTSFDDSDDGYPSGGGDDGDYF